MVLYLSSTIFSLEGATMGAIWRRHTAAFILWGLLIVGLDGPFWGLWLTSTPRIPLGEWLGMNLPLLIGCGVPPLVWIGFTELSYRLERRMNPDKSKGLDQ